MTIVQEQNGAYIKVRHMRRMILELILSSNERMEKIGFFESREWQFSNSRRREKE